MGMRSERSRECGQPTYMHHGYSVIAICLHQGPDEETNPRSRQGCRRVGKQISAAQ